MTAAHVLGDLQLHPDGSADGWCWSPQRPEASLAWQIMVDDRLVAAGEAARPRPDLSVPGMTGEQRHGFWLMLPPGAVPRAGGVLLSARERASGVVFGRRLVDRAGHTADDPAHAALAAALGALSARLAQAGARRRTARDAALRRAAAELALALPACGARRGAGVAAARRLLAPLLRGVRLADPAAPDLTLLLPPGTLPATAARLRALAPGTHRLNAETLLADPGSDARVRLLPSLAPGLRLVRVADTHPEAILDAAKAAARTARIVTALAP